MSARERMDAKKGEVRIHHDVCNEQVVVAAALVDDEARRVLVGSLQPDQFFATDHRVIWTGLQEIERKKLSFDPATMQQLVGGELNVTYMVQLMTARPEVPPNLKHHVGTLLWDHTRITAVKGPISGLLEAVRDPKSPPERVRALARQVADSFEGHRDRRHVRDSEELVRQQVADMRERMAGRAVYPFGIQSLDEYEDGRPRLVPGSAPGRTTIITGVSGSGKSTLTGHLILGLARQKRRVTVGAWEVNSGMTLEMLACLSLGWSRTALMSGSLEEGHLEELTERMHAITKWVTFVDNPFLGEAKARGSNEQNLDTIYGIISDTGCEVFIADLWERCLASDDPSEEKRALFRQQAMLDRLKVHGCFVTQQKLKEIEQRPDKRPTRECIKGSAAYVEIADTILGTHRPALWKAIDDTSMEIDVLKQRFGPWPLAIEFAWDADTGQIKDGKSITYDQPGEAGSSGLDAAFEATERRRGGKKGRGR